MSFEGQYKATKNVDFRGRVTAAMVKAAKYIILEPPETPAHPQRYNLALAVVKDPNNEELVTAFAWECAINGTIEATIQADGSATANDTDIEYVVNAVWDTVVNLKQM